MSALRKRCEEAADTCREIFGGCRCGPCQDGRSGCDFVPPVADIIEREAKRFAEAALRGILGCTDVPSYRYDSFVAEAIKAAEGVDE